MVEDTQTKTERCAECARLEANRKQAEQDRDLSKVTDCNVLMHRHQIAHQAGAL